MTVAPISGDASAGSSEGDSLLTETPMAEGQSGFRTGADQRLVSQDGGRAEGHARGGRGQGVASGAAVGSRG